MDAAAPEGGTVTSVDGGAQTDAAGAPASLVSQRTDAFTSGDACNCSLLLCC